MKKVGFLFVMMLSLMVSNVVAQQSGDFFPGKWDMLLLGTPDGDMKLTMSFERNDGKLEATIQIQNSESVSTVKNIVEKENSITFIVFISGYEVDFLLEKVDDDNIKGDVADMFDIKGQRIKID